MEEEDELSVLDYRTPKGQLIKLLEQKIKKPEIDDSLGKVLDQFSQFTNEQTAFLDNGIFHMNFAEDALLLQSCGQYYAKRVDKLWDELLQFHTRMVKYDEVTAKKCTDSNKREARKKEIARLEERLNRGKRKKIVLTEPENDIPPTNGCFLFDIDQEECSELFNNNLNFPLPEEGEVEIEEQPLVPFEHDFEIFDEWRAIRRIDEEERRRNGDSVLVAQYHRLRYRFKHYSTPSSDEMIYDWSDPEEFNTREGRLISFHHIKHLFDYNDSCLLPDEDFTVARLRIAYSLKKKWFLKNRIDPNAPYETYKEAWEKYQKDFFENEKRKIQNMPQSNPEELMRFYKALAKKEQLAIQKVEKLRAMGVKNLPIISFETVIVAPAKEGYDGIFDPYIPEDFDAPPKIIDISEELVPPPLDGEHEAELSTLLGDLTKLHESTSQTLDKPRSDSGYFDGGFEADDESDHEDRPEGAAPGSDTPFEFDKENTEKKDESTSNPLQSTTDPVNIDTGEKEVPPESTEAETSTALHVSTSEPLASSVESHVVSSISPESPFGSTQPTNLERCIKESEQDQTSNDINRDETSNDINRDDMNNAIKEFAKHATSDQHLVYSVLENSYFNQTDYMITIVYDKPCEYDSDDESIHGDKIMVFGSFYKSNELGAKQAIKRHEKNIETKAESKEVASKKRKLEQSLTDDPLPKRRKLSRVQVAKLKRSLVEPVKEQKWDNFFSLNYQPEAGEGEVGRVEYNSDLEDEELFDDIDINEAADSESKSADHDDPNVSDHSDHDRSHDDCLPESAPLQLSQDSGINMDTSIFENEENSPKELEQDQPAGNHNCENSVTELSKMDLLADLSKSTGISREELIKEQQQHQIDKPKLTAYEQERENVRERVAEWKEHITSKLKKLDEHDFDIHEYGANIMNSMAVNERKPFSELIHGKSSAEVVRHFISSLQLANTLNVEICGAKKGELSNDTFELKLLSKERYHEHFQEYQAPSEETLRDRLKKVKEIRMQNKGKQCTKRKTSDDQQWQPETILKNTKTSKKASNSSQSSKSSKKIKILNNHIVRSTNHKSIEMPGASTEHPEFDFQQPSTSWQADVLDQHNAFDSAICDIAQTPTRSSIDSGFIPSCDEDFLEQFDQLQQISDTHLQSTPIKPRKILKIKLVRNKSSHN